MNPHDILLNSIHNIIYLFIDVPLTITIIKNVLPTIAGILMETKSFIFLPDTCINLPATEYPAIDIIIFNIVPI